MASGNSGSVIFSNMSGGSGQKLRVNWSESYDLSAGTSTVHILSVEVFSLGDPVGTLYPDLVLSVDGSPALTMCARLGSHSCYTVDNDWAAVSAAGGGAATGSVTLSRSPGAGSALLRLGVCENADPALCSNWGAYYAFAPGTESLSLTPFPAGTLRLTAGTGSSITVTRGGVSLNDGAALSPGDRLTISFQAAAGYRLDTHTVNGSDFPSGESTVVTGDVTVVSSALPLSYTLSVDAGLGCAVTVSRGGQSLADGDSLSYGEVLAVSAAAASGYRLRSLTLNGSAFQSGGTHTVTGGVSVVCRASALESSISAPDGVFGSPLVITVTRYSAAYTTTITYSCAGESGTVVTGSRDTGISWTPPAALMHRIPNGDSAVCNLTALTLDGNDTVGSRSIQITLTVPAELRPGVESGWAALGYDNSGTAAAGVAAALVGVSRLRVTVDLSRITLPYSATLRSLRLSYGGETRTRTTGGTETFGVIGGSPAVLSWTVTDSRGRSAAGTLSLSAWPYAAPSLRSAQVQRCDSGGTADPRGAWVRVQSQVSYSDAGGAVGCALTARLRPSGGAYGSPSSLTPGVAALLGGGLSYLSSYVVELRATDDLGGVGVLEFRVPTAQVAFHLKEGGGGGAFGKYAERAGLLDLDWGLVARSLNGLYLPAPKVSGADGTVSFTGTLSESGFLLLLGQAGGSPLCSLVAVSQGGLGSGVHLGAPLSLSYGSGSLTVDTGGAGSSVWLIASDEFM